MLKKCYKVSGENKLLCGQNANNLEVYSKFIWRWNIFFGFDEGGIGYKWRRQKNDHKKMNISRRSLMIK